MFDPKATTLDSEAQTAVQGNPDAWLFITFCGDFAKLRGPLTRTGKWDPKKSFGSDTMQNCSGDKKIVPGMQGTQNNSVGAAFPAYQALFESKKPANIEFQGFTSQAFDSVFLGFLAALQAGSSDPTVIGQHAGRIRSARHRLHAIHVRKTQRRHQCNPSGQHVNYEGASGPIAFAPNGDITVNQYVLWQAQADGSTPPVKKITFTPKP